MNLPEQYRRLGLFIPFTTRLAKAHKLVLIKKFATEGRYLSTTGFTMRLITDFCIEHKLPFSVRMRFELDKWRYALVIDQETATRAQRIIDDMGSSNRGRKRTAIDD